MIDWIGRRSAGKGGMKDDFGLEQLLFNEIVAT